ncbi:MAG: hypothetical protein R6U46_10200 [Marinilabilia sp.]
MRIFFVCIGFFLVFHCSAQIRDLKSNIKKDKENEESGHSDVQRISKPEAFSPPTLGEDLAEYITVNLFYYTIYGAYRGIELGQYAMQVRRDKHPETFSLEGELLAGFDFRENTMTLSPSVRGNWGLFASDLRFRHTEDVTGGLQALDWQVLMLRLPVKTLKLEYGLGFSHVFSPSKTYFDQSAGLDWRFPALKTTLKAHYQWSQKTSLGERYRQETSVMIDYEAARAGRFRFSPTAGFGYNDYFGSTQFRFVQLGLKVRFF